MKTRKYAEQTEGYNIESKNDLSIDYLTEAESDQVHTVLERVAEATLQSGMRFMKTTLDEGKGVEQVFLDAEDCSASVIANFVADLKDEDFDIEFRGTRQSMDHLVVIYESENLKVEKQEEEIETDEQD